MTRSVLGVAATFAMAATATSSAPSLLAVSMAKDGSRSASIGGSEWLTCSGAWMISSGGRVSSSANGSLVLKSVGPLSGSDAAGSFAGSLAKWQAADGTPFETSVRVYATHAVFGQTCPEGVKNASVGQGQAQALCRDGFEGWCKRDGLTSGFPLFRLAGTETKGVVSFQSIMSAWATQGASPTNDAFSAESDGIDIELMDCTRSWNLGSRNGQGDAVSKMDEFCIINEELCIQNDLRLQVSCGRCDEGGAR